MDPPLQGYFKVLRRGSPCTPRRSSMGTFQSSFSIREPKCGDTSGNTAGHVKARREQPCNERVWLQSRFRAWTLHPSPTGMKCRQKWQLPRLRWKGQKLVVAHYWRRDTCTLVADLRRRCGNHSPGFQRRNRLCLEDFERLWDSFIIIY